jgi:two-component system nitrate/nitrite response regulator NarL
MADPNEAEQRFATYLDKYGDGWKYEPDQQAEFGLVASPHTEPDFGVVRRSRSSSPGDRGVTRVLVCSPIRLYGEGLVAVLGSTGGIDVVGCELIVEDCVRAARALRPDVVLLDMAMPDAVRLVGALREHAPDARVVALAVPEVEGVIVACAEAGVAACVTRGETLDQLVATLSHVVRGDSLCSPVTSGVLLRRIRALALRVPREPDEGCLTRRELEVLGLLEEGLSNKQIARRLGIELSTVKNHVHNVLAKLGVARRAEAVAVHRRGMVHLDSFMG